MSYSPVFAQYGRTPCLENSGYVNPVFSASDIFGSPNPFNLANNSAELPFGADDTPLAQLAQPGLRGEFVTGSNATGAQLGKRETTYDQKSVLLTVAFVAIVAAALYYQ